MLVTDAQIHIWGRNTPQRPWAKGMEHAAPRPEFSAQELIAEMDRAGVDGAVLVPPGAYEGYRYDLVIEAAERWPERFRAMGQIDLRPPGARENFERLLEHPSVSGARLSFTADSHRDLFLSGQLDWVFNLMEKEDKPLMFYSPACLDRTEEIVRGHTSLPIALCHATLLQGDAQKPLGPRIDRLLAFAKYSNVSVKATSLTLQSHAPYPFADLHESLERILDAFSPRRVFWGTDLTRLSCTYREARDFFMDLPFLRGSDLDLVMGGALRSWLRW